MEKKTLGIVGSGKLGSIVARAWKDGFLEDYELVYIAGRDAGKAKKLAEEVGAADGGDIEGIYRVKPDYVAEAASIAFLQEHAEKILLQGSNLVVISIGAFADPVFKSRIENTARENNVHVHISNGVVGGFDILRTFALIGEADAHFTTHKGPASLKGTPLFHDSLMTDIEETTVFDGTAEGIIKVLPTKVNVAVASSLAASSPSATKTTMVSVPGMIGDDHNMTVTVEGNRAIIDVYTTDGSLAGWGIVATLQNITAPIIFG